MPWVLECYACFFLYLIMEPPYGSSCTPQGLSKFCYIENQTHAWMHRFKANSQIPTECPQLRAQLRNREEWAAELIKNDPSLWYNFLWTGFVLRLRTRANSLSCFNHVDIKQRGGINSPLKLWEVHAMNRNEGGWKPSIGDWQSQQQVSWLRTPRSTAKCRNGETQTSHRRRLQNSVQIRRLQTFMQASERKTSFVWIVNRIHLKTYYPFLKKNQPKSKKKKKNQHYVSTESKVQWGRVDSQTFF